MSLSQVAVLRTTALLLLAGFVALLLMVGVTFWLAVRAQDYSEEVAEARETRTALVELRSLIQDAETGQRGFLLTDGEESYLQPYERALRNVDAALQTLRQHIAESDKAGPVSTLDSVLHGKLAELAQTIDLQRAGRHAEAMAIVRTDQGKALMDQARSLFGSLLQETDARLNSRMQAQETGIKALRWSVIGGAGLIVIVVGISIIIALTYTRELLSARTELATLNTNLEERVTERTGALARANEELQRFAYIVGHDLRSPLVNVMGFTSELVEIRKEIFDLLASLRQSSGTPETPRDKNLVQEFDEAIGFIRTSTSKMDGLINAILKLSREGKRPLTPESIEMAKLVERAAADIQHRVSERGGEIALEGAFPTIVSDRFALEQVFGNLLDNAVKYSDASRPPEIRIKAGPASREAVVIDVSDNGRGIASNDLERVFELFRRAGRQDQPGEGIGLAHVRAHVRRLGGDITVSSELGVGTTFHLRLPRVFQEMAAA